MQETLEATLLQWSPADFPFREIAFAVLCLASGGENLAFLRYIERQPNTHGLWEPKDESSEESEFIAYLAAGAHLKDLPPGSAPVQTIYWLDGVLVHFASQLYHAHVLEAQISFIVSYCGKNHAGKTVDAILISIEHVILLRITPNANLQRSALLTLFNVPNHLSMDVMDRYHTSYLEKLGNQEQREEERAKCWKKPLLETRSRHVPLEGDKDFGLLLRATQIGAEGDPSSTFFSGGTFTMLLLGKVHRSKPRGISVSGKVSTAGW